MKYKLPSIIPDKADKPLFTVYPRRAGKYAYYTEVLRRIEVGIYNINSFSEFEVSFLKTLVKDYKETK